MDESSATAPIDELFEFSAPCFFDFMKGESAEETRHAELWFETALSYAPSPFMTRIKTGSRYFQVQSLCNFRKEDQMQKASESSGATASNSNSEDKPQAKLVPDKVKEEIKTSEAKVTNDDKDKENIGTVCAQENGSALSEKSHLNAPGDEEKSKSTVQVVTEACTPKPLMISQKKLVSDKKHQTAKKIASTIRNSSVLKPKTGNVGTPNLSLESQSTVQVETEACTPKPLMNSHNKLVSDKKHQTAKTIASTIRNSSVLKPKTGNVETPNLALESQAIKRQKLDSGRSRQILNVKPHNLPHKSKLVLSSGSSNLSSSTAKSYNKLDRKVYVREQATSFVSMAEMMNKFQSCTRDLSPPGSSLSNDTAATVQKPMLKLTRPKEPEFETAQRMRPVRVKSTTELEEEMMAKIPKFKARPLNKKIFEASTPLPSLPRSTPMPPEFQEFHFETMARASKNVETSSVASTEVSRQNNEWKPQLTEPKSPVLQTSLRAKPPKVKSSIELEKEELEKAPKFKARPLNKMIFESKGELGIFFNAKKQVTIPQEFHFATHERIPPPPPVAVFDLLDKLSLNSESSHDPIPRNTIPHPFHLHTEERGAEKEKKFVMEILEKQFEEEQARVPKATPYPYTTDYPVVPLKPEPKQCTKLEPFQLESLIKEKEMIYKRYREESEAARLIEEEKALKQLRRTMVPHARPVPKFDNHFCPQSRAGATGLPPPTGGGCSRTFEALVKQLKTKPLTIINRHVHSFC
ncbi:Protein TPX2 [Hibiscus syriacus]|uniref:Protein TPX2 n=1 Tax=Hibiscus syriacus TaxID=106335 RepID=A0A6A2X409_HIBSY|nr:Protein TPX2 [Hibiscus syriacus]